MSSAKSQPSPIVAAATSSSEEPGVSAITMWSLGSWTSMNEIRGPRKCGTPACATYTSPAATGNRCSDDRRAALSCRRTASKNQFRSQPGTKPIPAYAGSRPSPGVSSRIHASVLPNGDPRCRRAQSRVGWACSGTGPDGDNSFTSTPVCPPSENEDPSISAGHASMTLRSVTGPAPGSSTMLSPWTRPSGSALPAQVHEPTQSSDHQSSGRSGRPRNDLVSAPPS